MTKSTATLMQKEHSSPAQLGFWLYIMSDLMLFAAFFATYMILRPGANDGPSSGDIFDVNFALVETLVLLASSFTCGLAYLAAKYKQKVSFTRWLAATLVLGLVFLGMEIYEFAEFILAGHGPDHSAFLSGFFSLVGLHGLHITAGIIWGVVLLGYITKRGLNKNALRRLGLFSVFWHFLDVVWIFIFTIVYLMGVVS
ncbi:cytochrome o ubiquinol oxidase subunit III [Candidatus Nomurabacteria bacterium]|nr:cytochrome o ubiquinol oxidase subunit III [Candidatus Nomurabacteria bacterium]